MLRAATVAGLLVILAGAASAQTNNPAPINSLPGLPLGVTGGGTGANLSATGGTSQVLLQTSLGGAITVRQLLTTDLSDIATFNLNTSGSLATTSTTNPTPAAGVLGFGGIAAAPTLGANGEGYVYLSTANGLTAQGQGSTYDLVFLNKSSTIAFGIPTGTANLNMAAGNINFPSGNTGLTGLGISAIGFNAAAAAFFSDSLSGDMAIRSDTGKFMRLGAGSGVSTIQVSSTSVSVTGTALPTQAAGTLGLAGTATAPTLAANSEGDVFLTAAGGLNYIGKGSGSDHTFLNSAGALAAGIPAGSTSFNVIGNVLDNGTSPTGTAGSGYVRATSPTMVTPILTGYAIASIPVGTIGMQAYVTDQITACPALSVAPTAGGALKCRVWYNGTAWVGD